MPRPTKLRKAALAREKIKKVARNAKAALLAPPELNAYLEVSVEGGPSLPLEPTVEVDIKEESVHAETPPPPPRDGPFLLECEVEIKEEELLDSEESSDRVVDASEPDPIAGGQPLLPVLQSTITVENEPPDDDNRCQFCFQLFQEAGGRGIITKLKIEFVLGLTHWDTPGKRVNCCEGCRKMFDLFYEFKQSCLVALARPVELLVWTGNKRAGEFVNPKPNSIRIKKTTKMVNLTQILNKTGHKPTVFRGTVPGAKKVSPKPKAVVTVNTTEAPPPTSASALAEFPQEANEAECAVCHEKVPNGLALSQHMLKHYPAESNESDPKLKESDAIPTESEAKPNESVAKPKKRVRTQSGRKKYCGFCRKYFGDMEVYTQHRPECAETFKRNKPPPPEFPCSLCPRKFPFQRQLSYHMDWHNDVRNIPCRREGCTKMFWSPSLRKTHENHCGKETAAICSICASVFKSDGALRVHMTTHGDPRFICEICNKGFYSKANLKKHAPVHSGERNYDCKICGKRFKSYEANRVHQRIHTDEKPYICHICGQRFMYNCLLKTHLEKGHDFVPEQQPAAKVVQVFPPNPFGGLGF